MAKGSAWTTDYLKLLFQAVAIANVADNAAASPLTNLYVSLHTADPGAGGNQNTNEISYTGYARVAVARNSGGWTVSGGNVTPVADVVFGAMTAGAGGTVTHFVIGTAVSGTGKILYVGTITPNLVVSTGTTPRLTTGSTVVES
jgi:hypothetical protein